MFIGSIMKKLNLFLLTTFLTASSSVFAIDGTITFNGELVDSTCTPTVTGSSTSGASKGNATVTLPTLNVSALSQAQATGGLTGFNIQLNGGDGTTSGCVAGDSNSKIATPYFESETAKVNQNGRVINTNAITGSKVDIEILNDKQQAININDDAKTQLVSSAIIDKNNYKYKYFARYYAVDKAVAGPVNGTLSYSIIYK